MSTCIKMDNFVKGNTSREAGVASFTNPIVDSWFLMGSVYPIIAIVAAYLSFVLVLGPRFMEKRKPFDLQWLLVAYNGCQVLFNSWLLSYCARIGLVTYVAVHGCNMIEHTPFSDNYILFRSSFWWYFMSKPIDLLDTVFFVLRKKHSQVTFLHVYHHAMMVLVVFWYSKYFPGPQGVYVGFINIVVHVIMYFYYMVAAMGPRFQKFIWWKKYITLMQLVQFISMLAYQFTLLAWGCNLPKWLSGVFIGHATVFLSLFANFYRAAYKKAKSL